MSCADLDQGLPKKSRLPLDPMIIETSAGHYQALWFVEPDGPQLNEEQWRGIGRRLAQDYQADPNAVKPAQGVRLAGTLNLKPDRNRFRVSIVNESCSPYAARQLLDAFRPIADPEPAYNPSAYASGEPRPGFSDTMEKRHRAYFERGIDADVKVLSGIIKGGRNDELYRRACRWGRYVHHKIASRQEIVARLMEACHANGVAKEDGEKACIDTIKGGIRNALNDRLDDLLERTRQTRHSKSATASQGKSEQASETQATAADAPPTGDID